MLSTANVIFIQNPCCQSNKICCITTLLNILDISFDPAKITAINHISSLDNFNLNNVLSFLRKKEVTFIKTNQSWETLFSCNTPGGNMIFIITTNNIHPGKEKHLTDNPKSGRYVILSLLIPQARFILLPFFITNKNLWFGSQIRTQDWSVVTGTVIRKTFDMYMSDNMYQN